VYRWAGMRSAEVAERVTLEGCQISYGQPCILIASNDTLRAPDPHSAPRQDMPRVRYSGPFQVDKVPMQWSGEAQATINAYLSHKGHKALAIRPIRLSLYVAYDEKSVAEAERKALAGCNALRESPFPCFLYAVNKDVVLPQRRTEPRQ
jgi:hypothetical protein